MDILPQKRCTKCGETKPLTEFVTNNRDIVTGHGSHCKVCHRAYKPKHPRQLKPKLSPTDPKTCNRCGETKPAARFDRTKDGDGYHNRCIDCARAWAREWKARNRDHIRAYEERNRDHLREIRYDWVRRNRDRHLAARRKLSSTPKMRLYTLLKVQQRRVSKNGTVTPDQIEGLRMRQKKCYYCKKPFTAERPSTIDHVIPLAKSGAHDISNIVLACGSCNSSKGDRLLRLI